MFLGSKEQKNFDIDICWLITLNEELHQHQVPLSHRPPELELVSSIRHRKFEVRAKILVNSVHLTFHSPIDIVDKTASFVARNGPSFESKVKDAEANNAKFNFLNPHDPYHAYYLHKVKEFMEGKATMPGGTDQGTPLAPTPVVQPPTTKVPFLSVSGD